MKGTFTVIIMSPFIVAGALVAVVWFGLLTGFALATKFFSQFA